MIHRHEAELFFHQRAFFFFGFVRNWRKEAKLRVCLLTGGLLLCAVDGSITWSRGGGKQSNCTIAKSHDVIHCPVIGAASSVPADVPLPARRYAFG